MSDSDQVLNAILTLTKTVEQYHGDFKEFRGSVTERVTDLEEDAKSDKLWHRVQTVCVIPVVAVLHQVATHFNWIK